MLILFKTLADSSNSTLITDNCAQQLNLTVTNFPQIYPAVNAYQGSRYSFTFLMDKYFHYDTPLHHTNDIGFVRLDLADFNFVYCDTPKFPLPWKLPTITSAFDPKVWLCIFISLTVSTFIIHYSISPNNKRQLSFIFFALITMLVSPSAGLGKITSKSGLLLLWTLVTFVLANYYSAVITSIMIIPPAEESMTEISQLLKNNYTLIFTNPGDLDVANATVNYFDNENDSTRNQEFSTFRALISRGVKVTGTIGFAFGQHLAFTGNVAAIDLWHNVLAFLDFANLAIAANAKNATTKKLSNKHCYIGKKLISSGSLYQIFTPPKGKLNVKIAKNLLESGIYSFWYTELGKIQYSARVQDRSKVKGPTKIIYEFEDATGEEFKPLKLEGRIKSVFFWCIAVGFLWSFSCFILEHFCKCLNSNWNKWKNRNYGDDNEDNRNLFSFVSITKSGIIDGFIFRYKFCGVNSKKENKKLLKLQFFK